MADPVDFGALRRVFTAPTKPDADTDDCVVYKGEAMPRWLARDLMQERAAIMEYCGGMARAEAQRVVCSNVRELKSQSRFMDTGNAPTSFDFLNRAASSSVEM